MGKIRVNLGGDRLGTGNDMNVTLRDSGRATHNLSRVIKTTSTTGTLVPFMVEPMMPMDTADIKLTSMIKTHPTTGPLFGVFKVQLDLFKAPMRYYIAALHNNKNKIGRAMENVSLPQMTLSAAANPMYDMTSMAQFNLEQIAPDSALSYLGIRGLGRPATGLATTAVTRTFNAIPALMYVDIYKMYYANQQEGIGAIMAALEGSSILEPTLTGVAQYAPGDSLKYNFSEGFWKDGATIPALAQRIFPSEITRISISNASSVETLIVRLAADPAGPVVEVNILDSSTWATWDIESVTRGGAIFTIRWAAVTGTSKTVFVVSNVGSPTRAFSVTTAVSETTSEGSFRVFNLDTIDEMREQILQAPTNAPFEVTTAPAGLKSPYVDIWGVGLDQTRQTLAAGQTMGGLLIKTHLSDRFNNWLNTDWIDGANGITNTSAIDVSEGLLTMDALNLSKKIYDLLNRVVAAGATYKDWLSAVWNVTSLSQVEMPMFVGGASGEIMFDEVVSTAEAADETGSSPLGTLAGKGRLDQLNGGKIRVANYEEPSFLMGIFSITPRIDYAQGNKWFTRILNMDEWHKPQLDGIGFQELPTEELAAWDTVVSGSTPTFRSAGKQPAWIEYMTSQNETYGRFAVPSEEMFMTLTRLYDGDGVDGIGNLTTYIDPVDYLQAFATGAKTDQHFWVQIGIEMQMRRKISAKMIPNL